MKRFRSGKKNSVGYRENAWRGIVETMMGLNGLEFVKKKDGYLVEI